MSDPLVHLVKGTDPTLREDTAHALVERLLAGEDRTYALEGFRVPARGERAPQGDGEAADGDGEPAPSEPAALVRAIAIALSTPPFVTSRRVVVVRNVTDLDAAGAELLAAHTLAPCDGTYLVMVVENRRKLPGALDKAVRAAAVATVAPSSEKTVDVVGAALRAAHLRLTAPARERLTSHLGEDAGRAPELVALLAAAFDAGAELDVADVEPYLGEAGTIARWALTDAIDSGDAPRALEAAHRLMHATSGSEQKSKHPMQLMATLAGHYLDLARLDSPAITTKDHAHGVLGGSPFPAHKKLRAAQHLGSRGIAEAIALVADADIDLRGGYGGRRAVPPETTIEVLVARLASLARRHGAASGASRGAGRRRTG